MNTKTLTTQLNADMVLVELPDRDLLERVAVAEGFDDLGAWIDHALLSWAHMTAVRHGLEPVATDLAVKLLGRRVA